MTEQREGQDPSREAQADSKVSRKVADRPHNITILLGLLSPMLAIVALIVSLEALRTSKTAMVDSQRAYISVEGADLSYADESVHYAFVIKNGGNTPASSIFVKYLVSTEDGGGYYVANSEKILDMGPKEQRTYSGQLKREKALPVKVVGLAFYRDVFGNARNAGGCFELRDTGTSVCAVGDDVWAIWPRAR